MSRVDRSRLPPVAPTPPYAFPESRRHALGNGLSVRTIEHRDLPVMTCVLLLRAGSACDPDDRPGLAATTADLLDESSGGRSTLDVHRALDDIGAHCDVEIGADAVTVGLTTLVRFAEDGMRLLADMVAQPGMREEDFSRVRELRLHRLLQMRDQPGAIADRLFTRVLYGAHPYGHLPLGSASSLEHLGLDEVAAFHRTRYVPAASTLVVVGDATHDELARTADAAFASWTTAEPGAGAPPRPDLAIEDEEPPERLFLADRPGAAQSELRIGHLGVSRDTPDVHELLVLNAVLGGQFVSRINSNLREDKGYTYGARTAFDFREGRGPFIVQTSVASDATAAAVAEVLEEIRAIRSDRPPTDEELRMAKASITLGFPRGFESTEQVARAMTQIVLHGLPDDYFSRFGPAIESVTAEGVLEAARSRLDADRLRVAVVGDRATVEGGLADLGLGAPRAWTVDD